MKQHQFHVPNKNSLTAAEDGISQKPVQLPQAKIKARIDRLTPLIYTVMEL